MGINDCVMPLGRGGLVGRVVRKVSDQRSEVVDADGGILAALLFEREILIIAQAGM